MGMFHFKGAVFPSKIRSWQISSKNDYNQLLEKATFAMNELVSKILVPFLLNDSAKRLGPWMVCLWWAVYVYVSGEIGFASWLDVSSMRYEIDIS